MQLVIIPVITIGCGVLSSIFLKKVWVAPIVTLIINALDEIYYFKHYYSEIRLTSWNIILPIVSFIISLMIIKTIKTNKEPPIM
ncbi:hypothetical protein G9F72_010940 [Clostridium estertheticum]|uniref:hypothetical protein n=1 Tax=Clostridium estertheticum TaxID=238834 RepID=UPI001CD094F6|nr:hypothetical protein [Clostridium estertheticum]MBZ9686840.1 hypothetical protein [Clostridium estertheticum]